METCSQKKKKGACCVAVGCNMRAGTNLLSNIKMIRFPTNPERRKQWEIAVERENWKATKHSRLCSKHFISGKPSRISTHPDFTPSIFPHRKNSCDGILDRVDRYERNLERKRPSEVKVSNLIDASTMTDLTMNDLCNIESRSANSSQNRSHQMITFKDISSSRKKLIFYTKIPNIELFFGLLSFLTHMWTPSTKTMLSCREQLLLVMIKLRLGLLNIDLAYRFGIGSGSVSLIFREWTTRMALKLSAFLYWPSRESVNRNFPKCFESLIFKNTICIIDCTEVFIDTPFNLDARAHTYSHYKNHNTVKFLIACTPSGVVSFVSKLYGGRCSDKEITIDCGILDLIKNGDAVLADRGFLIKDILDSKGAKLIMPAFTKGKRQLGASEVTTSRKISKARVHIERCIRRVKSYRILKTQWKTSFMKSVEKNGDSIGDNILVILCALCNFSKPPLL